MLFFLLLLIQVLVFVGLVFLLRHLLTRNITGATTHLQQMSRDYTQKQQQAKKRLEEAEQYCQQSRAKVLEENNQMKVQFEKELQETKDNILQEARQESERIIKRAGKTGQLMVNELDQKIEVRALDRACELIQQVLPNHLHKQIHAQWFEELVSSGFDELEHLHVHGGISEAKVTSAFRLSSKQQELLRKKLKEKLDRNIELKEEVDPQVVAGVVVSLGSLVLDGSLKYKIKEAASVKQGSSDE